MLDPYVLLTFKGTLEKKELPRSCWRCWTLTSSLLLKEPRKKEKTPQELLEVLDPYVLLTFKGKQKKEKNQELHEVWILTSSLLLKEPRKKEKNHQELLEVLDPYVLLTFKGNNEKRKGSPGAPGGAGSLRPPYF